MYHLKTMTGTCSLKQTPETEKYKMYDEMNKAGEINRYQDNKNQYFFLPFPSSDSSSSSNKSKKSEDVFRSSSSEQSIGDSKRDSSSMSSVLSTFCLGPKQLGPGIAFWIHIRSSSSVSISSTSASESFGGLEDIVYHQAFLTTERDLQNESCSTDKTSFRVSEK